MKYELSLPYLRAFLGVVFIALSLAATVAFLGQGFSGLTFITIVCFVIAVEFVKILFSGDIGYYLALKQPEKALFSFAIVLILYILTVFAETWYLSNGNLKQSAALETSALRTTSLQQQITAKQAQLALCNPNHLTRCINPRTQELQALQSEFYKIQAAEMSQSEIIANQKFWQQMATATGTKPENLQMGLNVLRSALAEIIGLYLFAQFSTFKRLQNLDTSDLQSNHNALHGQALPDNNAAEVFTLMSAKLEQLEKKLEEKKP